MNGKKTPFNTIEWKDDTLLLLDQRILPDQVSYVSCQSSSDVSNAIKNMVVRGAPAIGIAAAYGVVLAAKDCYQKSGNYWYRSINPAMTELISARPTAVNLNWAVTRMSQLVGPTEGDPAELLLGEARLIHQEDIDANMHMARLGEEYLDDCSGVLTHCNAGALATGGHGTALGVIRNAYQNNNSLDIFVSETRPWMQGARLTVWELNQDGMAVNLITDSSAATLMKSGQIDWVIVGADRITANGDVVNKIGTYNHALTSRYHDVKFMVVAPLSTIDRNTPSGDDVVLENRTHDDFMQYVKLNKPGEDTRILNPVFDVTPAELIDVIITEKGAVCAPNEEKIRALFDV